MKYLDDDLVEAVSMIKDYLNRNNPGGTVCLSGDAGTFVVVSQDPLVIDGLSGTIEEFSEETGYEEFISVTVKGEGEC